MSATVSAPTLLLITASARQLPIIKKAHQLGWKVVATDQHPAAPAFAEADDHEVVDSLNVPGMIAIARKHRVDAVISEQTDVGVLTAATVAESLGLPGVRAEVARRCTDKWLMRQACVAAKIETPMHRLVETADDAARAAAEIGFPVVVKPVDSQASKGVSKVYRPEELAARFAHAKRNSRTGRVLVEEMMTGTESSVESYVANGEVVVLGYCEKTKTPPPFSVDTRLVYPGGFPENQVKALLDLNRRVVEAMGVTMGFTHAEYFVSERGPRLIEVAARGCGAGVATVLLPAMTGIDLLGVRLRQSIGEGVVLPPPDVRAGLLEFLVASPGTVTSVSGVADAARLPGVLEVSVSVQPGSTVGVIESGSARSGAVLAVGRTRDEVLQLSEELKRTIRITTEGSNG